jgi:nucleoside-diphosphate-sugar epimerase
VEVVRGDVTDRASAERAVRGARVVFHLAAVVSDSGDERVFQRVTVGGTDNVLGAAAAEGARAVLVSSVVAYGDALRGDACDEDHPFGRPLGLYSRSKQAQERLARELARTRGLQLTVVRPANVYGPGSKPWMDEVVTQLCKGLVGGGEGNAVLCHVGNLVDLLARAGNGSQALGRSYNAADGSDVTWTRRRSSGRP